MKLVITLTVAVIGFFFSLFVFQAVSNYGMIYAIASVYILGGFLTDVTRSIVEGKL